MTFMSFIILLRNCIIKRQLNCIVITELVFIAICLLNITTNPETEKVNENHDRVM